MVIFKQKQYDSSSSLPKTQPGGWPRVSTVINSGGTNGKASPLTQPLSPTANQQLTGTQQVAIQTQKALNNISLGQLRRYREAGIRDRAQTKALNYQSRTNAGKIQSSLNGMQMARAAENKKNVQLSSAYRTPTVPTKPIGSNNRTMIRK